MKTVAVLLLIAIVSLGFVGGAIAQTDKPAAPSTAAPGGSAATSERSTGASSKSDSAPASTSDDVSALPRIVNSERTTIFGLTPTAAVIIAASLLVVVILAIVAMTRSNGTYIER